MNFGKVILFISDLFEIIDDYFSYKRIINIHSITIYNYSIVMFNIQNDFIVAVKSEKS